MIFKFSYYFRLGSGSVEMYNRIWSEGAAPYAEVSGSTDWSPTYEHHPPRYVMTNAIKSNACDPITLNIDLPELTPHTS